MSKRNSVKIVKDGQTGKYRAVIRVRGIVTACLVRSLPTAGSARIEGHWLLTDILKAA